MLQRSVVVIGGGIIGLCTALSLQERGFKVTIADSGEQPKLASWGNAGRIAVELSEPLASWRTIRSLPGALFCFGGPVSLPLFALPSWLPFGLRLIEASRAKHFGRGREALRALLGSALPAWRRRVIALDMSKMLVELGHYSLWESAKTGVRGRALWRHDPGAASVADLSVAESDRLKQLLRVPLTGALRFFGTANIADLDQLLAALRAAFLQGRGQWLSQTLTVDAAMRVAELVVVTAGVESAPLLQGIGHKVPLIAERGYHLHQPETTWPNDMPPLYFEDRSLVVTRFRNGLRATSFVEFATRHAPPDARKWARLRQHVKSLGLPFDETATQWMGSRPTLPDYLPAIGRSSKRRGVFYATGHQHLGLTLAPLTGELMASLVSGEVAAVDLHPFDLDRFD